MVAMEICGSSQRKNGTRKRDVCSADIRSVEPIKMRLNQRRSGSQYLRNDLSLAFNEAVSVWESFPFTTGENFLDEKVDRPGSCRGDVIYSRPAAAFSHRGRRGDDCSIHQHKPVAPRHPPSQCAMAWRAASVTVGKTLDVSI